MKERNRIINQTLRKKAFKRDNFTCQKCKIQDKTAKILETHHIIPIYSGGTETIENVITLCSDCHHFAPDNLEDFKEYMQDEMEGTLTILMKVWKKVISEKMDELEILKKENEELKKEIEKLKSARINQKEGMIKKASHGKLMSRAPFGYNIQEGKLIPAQNFREVEEIFDEFLNMNISLTQLSKKHNFSVNGLKKILTNFTYIGKIKFNNEMHQGTHQPLISSTLFNHVQNKLERLGIK